MTESSSKSYVYENNEVVKTSRTAERKLTSGKTDQLVEITPKDLSVGSWKKWVRESDLYKVLV